MKGWWGASAVYQQQEVSAQSLTAFPPLSSDEEQLPIDY